MFIYQESLCTCFRTSNKRGKKVKVVCEMHRNKHARRTNTRQNAPTPGTRPAKLMSQKEREREIARLTGTKTIREANKNASTEVIGGRNLRRKSKTS